MTSKKSVTEWPLRGAKNIGDVIPETEEVAGVVKIEELLGVPICITGYGERKGDKSPYVFITFHRQEDKEPMGTTTGGGVVMEKLHKIREANAFPVVCKIVKIKEYYDLKPVEHK